MLDELIDQLRCAACCGETLNRSILEKTETGTMRDGVVWCRSCKAWYAVEDELLEFLPQDLAYHDDRRAFWQRYAPAMEALGLSAEQAASDKDVAALQRQQQTHFDGWAANAAQTYTDYAETPFWIAADDIAIEPWKERIKPGKWLLEIGCAQGRATFRFANLDIRLTAFDVSKKMVRQAIDRYRRKRLRARAVFFVADANRFPFKDRVFDYVLIYGVLHHLPKPEETCREVARVLKPKGIYFGQENNHTVFRFVFDWLQKAFPLWHEEAGPESIISRSMLDRSFSGTGMHVETKTSVFLPPHVVNLMNLDWAARTLRATDSVGRALPLLRDQGGVILITAEKPP